ncbi:T6SS phospholipase effector Tle1-like catalytic domain-containing protein [Sabulicella rubraurantiaca]|uniref:T6SS phospholipase effector Tle1-like catalytic domain-containing protein n=1 Tax=Sabulicella rubraurantiaca TaxID=2811429 RepID=UPI001A968CAE|nr:DUF2235 domain-containing protein [Sabulicella rubraurantiaca]
MASGRKSEGTPTTSRRRIILLLDGTWQDAAFNPRDTNIVRIREIVSRYLARHATPLRAGAGRPGPTDDGESVVSHAPAAIPAAASGRDDWKHLVYYQPGVGTRFGLDRFRGGGFGLGLDANVRRAYKFLSFHYEPGDEIYVFGFSRGAYTARSLVGYLAAAGLLTRQHCTPEREALAWSYYRTPPDDRSPGVWHALGGHVHDRDTFQIECIAVFDTVGALGVPLELLRRRNVLKYQFHNVEMPSVSRVNLHAVAIDEHRIPFEAAVWRQHKFKQLSSVAEQVWFPGAHSDVGGGYEDLESRRDQEPELDDLSLDWMLRRIRVHCPGFPCDTDDLPHGADGSRSGEAAALAPQHEPRTGFYALQRRARRSIANVPVPVGWWEVNLGRERHVVPAGEMIHVSALERLGREVAIEGRTAIYAPPSLLAVLEAIGTTYGANSDSNRAEHPIPIVDWSGEQFDPAAPAGRKAALRCLDAARQRLQAAGF